MITAATARKPTDPIRMYIILLLFCRPAVGTITAGSEKPPPPNTGRSSIDPIDAAGLAAPPPEFPRYAFAIERMSIRPEPSPPAAPLA